MKKKIIFVRNTQYDQVKTGDTVYFGTYPVTAKGNDLTPISWFVLEKNQDKLFLISVKILDCLMFHDKPEKVDWRKSEIREWLNGHFYNTAFNGSEKGMIIPAANTQNGHFKNGVYTGNSPDTTDKVFLPNVGEVIKFFGKGKDVNSGFSTPKDSGRAFSTTFARLPAKKKQRQDECKLGIYGDPEARNAARWWLRNLGNNAEGKDDYSAVSFVDYYGNVDEYGAPSDFCVCGVRPCIVVNLSK